MTIPFKTMQGWQEEMRAAGLRGCLACLCEAIKQGYLCPTEAFCYETLTFTCPRHQVQTMDWREFFIEFVKGLDAAVILSGDCPNPALDTERIFILLKNYYESGAFHRVQRAHIPRGH